MLFFIKQFYNYHFISFITNMHIHVNKSSAVADMMPEHLYKRIHQRPSHNCKNNVSSTFDVDIRYGKIRMDGLQSHEGCMMIDTIHQRDRYTATQIATSRQQ